jgi:hypothetical protein
MNQKLPESTERTAAIQDSRCQGRVSNQAPLEYEPDALQLRQSIGQQMRIVAYIREVSVIDLGASFQLQFVHEFWVQIIT